jgi:hypothetical protein
VAERRDAAYGETGGAAHEIGVGASQGLAQRAPESLLMRAVGA